jgi:hypothetical protein
VKIPRSVAKTREETRRMGTDIARMLTPSTSAATICARFAVASLFMRRSMLERSRKVKCEFP